MTLKFKMKKKMLYIITLLFVFSLGGAFSLLIRRNKVVKSFLYKIKNSYDQFDDTRKFNWGHEFKKVELISKLDNTISPAYFYKSKSTNKKPPVVSLHSWSGDYSQKDPISNLCKSMDFNYIHPNFRGPNNSIKSCCSSFVINDIDESINYAIEHSNVDTDKIYIIGSSGGGYATLSSFMKSNLKIKRFSAWASITDLELWYNENKILNRKYANDILNCTGSKDDKLNIVEVHKRSPLFWDTPKDKALKTEINIYAGIYDGFQIKSKVTITHSINFYGKLLKDLEVSDSALYVSNDEKLKLLEYRKPLKIFA